MAVTSDGTRDVTAHALSVRVFCYNVMFRQAENEMWFCRLFVWILYILLAQVKGYEEAKSYAWAGVKYESFF